VKAPEPIERGKPIESMQPCGDLESMLPADFGSLPLREALRLLIAARVEDSGAFYRCARHKAALVDWINDE
jgi:hypothetical protein